MSTDPNARSSITTRSVLLGIALSAFYAWLAPMVVYRMYSAEYYHGILPPGVLIVFFVVLAANLVVRSRVRSLALSASELIVVFGMLWIAAASFQIGMIGNTLSVMSAPEYFATPENRWNDIYVAHLPSWITPSDRSGGVRLFYNGLPPGGSIPWHIWHVPLVWWGSLIAALLGIVICLMTIVHEQWHDHEKLAFPMADIPLTLAGSDEAGGGMPSWARSKLFWIGLGIPLAFMAWNMVHWFLPLFPHIAFTQDESGINFRFLPHFYTKLDFFTIGLAYFAPLQILRGLWLGRLIIAGEIGIGNKFGFGVPANSGYMPWSDWHSGTVAWQCLGSLVMFVLWGFWVGREHFAKVLRSALSGRVALPAALRRRYGAAVWGLVAGLVYLAFWFKEAGMSWPVITLFLPMLVILTLGISKVVAESSLLFIDSPANVQSFVMQTLGVANIPQASMTALVLSYVVFRSNKGLMMPQVAFAGRMGDERNVPRGKLYAALGVAAGMAIIVALVTTIMLGYDGGALNFQTHAFRKGHVEAYAALASASSKDYGPDSVRLTYFGVGMALMSVVLSIRARFANFWLHPVGLTFATTSVASLQTMNLFLVWLAKMALMRFGGIHLVNRAKPLFLGFLSGHAIGLGLGLLVDAIWFPGQGHDVATGW